MAALKRLRVQTPDQVMPVEEVDDPNGPMVRYEDAAQAIATARQQERDGTRRLGESIDHLIRSARKLLDDTDAEGRSYHVDRQALEAVIAGAEVDFADVLGDGADTIDPRRRQAKATVEVLREGLAGIEDRLSEINDAVRG